MAPKQGKKKTQGSLDSFFGVPKKKTQVSSPEKTEASLAPKRKSPEHESVDPKRKKRLIIDDDSSDEEEGPIDESHGKMDVENQEHSVNETGKSKESENSQKVIKARTPSSLVDGKATKTDTESTTTDELKPKSTPESSLESKSETDADKSGTVKDRIVSDILAQSSKNQFKSDAALEKEATWTDSVPYAVLCEAFGEIEPITGRLAIQEIVTNLFRKILLRHDADMATALYLASNSVAAAYECVELGIGDAILVKAICEATGTSTNMVKQKYEEIGDLGSVAQTCKSKQKTLGGFFTKAKSTAGLSASEVLRTFRQIAKTKGSQSQKWKVDLIKRLLVKASSPMETKYIIRGLQGKLRIGLAQTTVLISLAHALTLTIPSSIVVDGESADETKNYPKEAKQYMDKSCTVEKRLEAAVAIVKKAYSEVPSYEAVLDSATKVPLERLHAKCTLKPGIPIEPMLAKPTKSIQEVLKRLNGVRFTCEYKYDGERAQIHLLSNGDTKVFSRNLLDTSEKYPEVPGFVKESCKDVDSFVLDAEVVAFNNKTGQLVPFQVLSTRKKTEESAETAKVQVIVQAFDLMYLNGKSLLNSTLAERRELLFKHFEPVEGKFQFAKSIDHEENGETTVLEDFLDSAVKGQCEGLMVKTLDDNAIYEPSRRSLNWLKLKKDYLEGLGDSFDLVPLGAYHGKGKRTGFYGAYLLACYDPDTEEFQSVCKIGTGFSDEDLKELAENLNKHKLDTKSSQYSVSGTLECDVWFDPVEVWEVKAADLSKSSAHRGAEGKTGEEGRGIGLRFPRFERIREDKKPEDATTSDQILEMYYNQDTVNGDDDGADE